VSDTRERRSVELWGEEFEVISEYSRAQAIEDGFLVDVTETAKEAGFKIPVALTRAVWNKYVEVPEGVTGQDIKGRLWDILWMLYWEIKENPKAQETLLFKLHVRDDNRERPPPLVTLKAVCGPGDNGDPVITIMLREED